MTARALTLREAAERLGIDPSTYRRRANAGLLPITRVGSIVRVDPERLERFLSGAEDAQGRPLHPEPATPPARDPSGTSADAAEFVLYGLAEVFHWLAFNYTRGRKQAESQPTAQAAD